MKKGILIFGLGLLLIALTGCAQQATESGTIGITPEDFAAACEEAGYTSSDESASGAQGAPALAKKDISGIKIGKVAVTTSASSCESSCDYCRCDDEGNNCKCDYS